MVENWRERVCECLESTRHDYAIHDKLHTVTSSSPLFLIIIVMIALYFPRLCLHFGSEVWANGVVFLKSVN